MSDPEKLLQRPFAEVAASLKKQLEEERASVLKKPGKSKVPLSRENSDVEAQSPTNMGVVDENALLRREMQGVQPLSRENYVPPPQRKSEMIAPPDEEAEVMAQLADLVAGRSDFDFADSDEYIEGIAQGLNRNLLKKLRQGTFAVQAHLDLHGKTRVEARSAVESFILDSRHRGRRCVLIVHGRGLNSKD